MQNKVQVESSHYNWRYDSLKTWTSFYYQIDNILKHANKEKDKILEIGIGNGFVTDKLRKLGYNVTTVDFDECLSPDFVADVRSLPFNNNSFDIVCAFEVLEHLPFCDFDKALKELKRVVNKKILISLPYSSFTLWLGFKIFPYVKAKQLEINIPHSFRKHKFNGQHYWELGKKGFSIKKVMKHLKINGFILEYKWKPPLVGQVGFCAKKDSNDES